MMRLMRGYAFPGTLVIGLLLLGCGDPTLVLNPSFVNFTVGGVVPLTPGESTGFVLIRTVNQTNLPIEFLVTIEREAVDTTGDGAEPTIERESFRLRTFPDGLTSEVGILLDCPILRVGLGENLDFPNDEPGLFIITTQQQGVSSGFGVPSGINPLDSRFGNFACGDTIIFEAIEKRDVAGNVAVNAFVLSGADQPQDFSGPDTFNNARSLVDQFSPEE